MGRSIVRASLVTEGAMALVLLLMGVGCAENSVFELTLSPPTQVPAGANFIVIDFRSDEPFRSDVAVAGGAALNLGIFEPSHTVSLVASGEALNAPLHARARYCAEEECLATEDQEVKALLIEFERPFYQGVFTEYALRLPALPEHASEVVPRCDIAAPSCREGMPSSWCHPNGDHFCEALP